MTGGHVYVCMRVSMYLSMYVCVRVCMYVYMYVMIVMHIEKL
jgi:hypothetical protein